MQYSSARVRFLLLNVLLTSILLTGCGGEDAGTSVVRGQDAEEAAVQILRFQMEAKTESLKEVVAPPQKNNVDFSTLEESVVPKGEVYLSHTSFSADSSFLKEEHGHVLVSAEGPDMEKMMKAAGMSFSEQRSLATTLEDGDPEVVRNRIDKLVKEAEESLGSVPTTEEKKVIPVLKSSEGEWKAVLRSRIDRRVEGVREDLRFSGAGERAVSTFREVQNLAPTLEMTQEFAEEVAAGRVEKGRDLLRNDRLEKAEEALSFAEEQAPELKETKAFADEVTKARKEFTYADSMETKIVSSDLSVDVNQMGFRGGDQSTVDINAKASKTLEKKT